MEGKKSNYSLDKTIGGMHLKLFLPMFAVIVIAMYLEILPVNFAGGLIVAMSMGLFLMWLGNQIPIFNTFGGGALLCILVPAVFVHFSILPESVADLTDTFYNDIGFSDFAVTGIIVGSILSMDRDMLLKIGVRFFIPLITTIVFTLLLGGVVGHLMGFGFSNALYYVVGPIMGGGMAAGAVPLSEVMSSASGESAGDILGQIAPAVMVANIITILVAAILNGLGKQKFMPSNFSGEGDILRKKSSIKFGDKEIEVPFSINALTVGMLLATTIFAFGQIMASIVPTFHYYVWIILGAAALKLFNILPRTVEDSTEGWYDFITKAWVPAILVSISAGMIDFVAVIDIVTNPTYISLTIITVTIAVLVAGFAGLLVGFYFIESAISSGLGLADMGGSGDVAVLSASERMGLMPFLQISSRIGGAIILVILSVLAPFLL